MIHTSTGKIVSSSTSVWRSPDSFEDSIKGGTRGVDLVGDVVDTLHNHTVDEKATGKKHRFVAIVVKVDHDILCGVKVIYSYE